MAARTGVNMSETWNCKLNLINATTNLLSVAPVNSVGFGAMLCTASIYKKADQLYKGPAKYHAAGDPPPEGEGGMGSWFGNYFWYEVSIYGPGLANGIKIPLMIFLGDDWKVAVVGVPLPVGSVVSESDSYELSVSISVSGLFLKGQMEDLSEEDRGILDYTDEGIDYLWYANGSTTSTITASGPGISETFTGSWGTWGAGDEVDILVGDTFGIAYTIGLNIAHQGVQYCSISDLKWGSDGTINLTGINSLYSTNGSTWSRTVPGGSTYWYMYNGNLICPMYHGSNSLTDSSWTGSTMAPYIVEYRLDGDSVAYFDIYGETVSMAYLSNYIVWDDEESYHLEPVSDGLLVTQAASSWNEDYPNEWQNFTSRDIIVYQRETERNFNKDDVADGVGMSRDDAQRPIPIPKLDATTLELDSYGGCFWANWGSVAHTAYQSVNDPILPTTRPSFWTSSTVTVDGTNNDLWTLDTESTGNTVTRTFVHRVYDRLNRLAGGYNAGDEYGPHWVHLFKANMPDSTTLDDPDWISAKPYEDIYNWSNYSYMLLTLTSGIAGEVTFRITYKVPTITDPFYSCAEYRWDEFEVDYATYTLNWTFDVVVGSNTILLDKMLNDEGNDPIGAARVQIVDTVSFILPDNPSTTETLDIELTDILLTMDPGEGERTEPTTHVELRYKRHWQWYENHSVGIHAYCDGLPNLEIDYGQTIDKEYGIPSTQRVEHCPTTQDQTSRLDSARILSSFMDIDMQEGWEASSNYDTVVDSASNVDVDSNALVGNFYFWDHFHEQTQKASSTIYLSGCKHVGQYSIAAGAKSTIWVIDHPRARIHGISYNSDRTLRKRNEADVITLYANYNSTGWYVFQAGIGTDDHGRFITHGLNEPDFTYRINDETGTLSVKTREYTIKTAFLTTYFDPFIITDDDGLFLLIVEADDIIAFKTRDGANLTGWEEVSKPYGTTPMARPSICSDASGLIFCAASNGTDTVVKVSTDYGRTWSDILSLGVGLQYGTIWYSNGSLYVCGNDGTDIRMESTSKQDYSLDVWNGTDSVFVCTAGSATSRSFGFCDSQGMIHVVTEDVFGSTYHDMVSVTSGFAETSAANIGDDIFSGTGCQWDGDHAMTGYKTVDSTNYVVYRQSTDDMIAEQLGVGTEIEVTTVDTAIDQDPKSCVAICKNGYYVIVGYAGNMSLYKFKSITEGFERF